MAEKLIVLSDGTGNSAAKFFKTNVWKVYEALNLSHEGQQIACYDDGVGTSKIKPLAILGGVFGYGLKRNVLNIYSFLSRHYAQGNTPEIYGFGFSRGAFTIRVVVGLIESQGLLPDLDDREMRRMAKLAYRSYRKERCHTLLGVEVPFRALRDAIVGVWHRVRKLPEYDSQKNVRNVAIRFLGLWDTVNAYGMPIQELRRAIDKFIFPMTFASRKLLGCCECARHALSIDDERSTFAPVLWDHDNDADLKQLWFCGSHSNVGGGYPDDRLASAPLAWIVKEAESAGLSFRPEALTRIRSAVTPYGRLYDSRSGFRAFYRYKPRQIECDLQKRVFPTVHESVLFRMATGFQGYAPIALPQKIQVIDKNGVSLFFEGFQKKIASEDLDAPSMAAFAPPDRPVAPLASLVAKLKAPDEASVEHIRAAILQRRLAYYGMLFTTLCLLIFPIIFSADQFEPSGATSIATLLSAPLKELELITPSYLSPWLESFVRSPVFAWSLIALAFGSYIWGTKLKTKIADLARAAWQMGDAFQSKAKRTTLDKLADQLAKSATAHVGWDFLRWKGVPLGVLVLLALTALVLLDRAVFRVQAAFGFVCTTTADPKHLTPVSHAISEVVFAADEPCHATGLRLQQGQTYSITMEPLRPINSGRKGTPETFLADGGIEADLAGVNAAKLSWDQALLMRMGVPFRRHLRPAWFSPIARIGELANDEYPLAPQVPFQTRDEARRTLVSRLAARSSGELFLFVNDAYAGFVPIALFSGVNWRNRDGSSRHTYGNNTGTFNVKVKRLR